MSNNTSLINPENILKVNANGFENIALAVFYYQYNNNKIYNSYCNALHIDVISVKRLIEIPFLPISFFKSHKVVTGNNDLPEMIFESSGTTGEIPSRHYVTDKKLYEHSLLQGFEQFYGHPSQYAILALLPSYLERKNASLVHMAKTLMEAGSNALSGFYINELGQLYNVLHDLEKAGQKTLLLGVTFALIDFADKYPMQLTNTIVMETGGMKGRREELTRTEVHELLKKQLGLNVVHSEYGMTELLSQAYSKGEEVFNCTNTIKVLVRDIYDPLEVTETGIGCLNIIDLASVNSCSFIATDDIGKVDNDGSFEVLGRLDNSTLRGCNLMVV